MFRASFIGENLMRSRLIIKALQWAAGIWLVLALALPVVKDVPAGHWTSNHIRAVGVSGGSVISPRGDSMVGSERADHAMESHAGSDFAHMTCCTMPMTNRGAGTATARDPEARRGSDSRPEIRRISRTVAPEPLPPRSA